MSATIGNLPELAKFLEADVYHKDFRPVELREFIKCGADLLEIKKDADSIENAFVWDRSVSFNVSIFINLIQPKNGKNTRICQFQFEFQILKSQLFKMKIPVNNLTELNCSTKKRY